MPSKLSEVDKLYIIQTINSIFPKIKIYAFGSRIRGDAKKYSDLDLALDGNNKLDLRKLGNLEELFSNSNLPYKIDIIDFHRITEDFKKHIIRTSVAWE